MVQDTACAHRKEWRKRERAGIGTGRHVDAIGETIVVNEVQRSGEATRLWAGKSQQNWQAGMSHPNQIALQEIHGQGHMLMVCW